MCAVLTGLGICFKMEVTFLHILYMLPNFMLKSGQRLLNLRKSHPIIKGTPVEKSLISFNLIAHTWFLYKIRN